MLYNLICNNGKSVNACGLYLEDVIDNNVSMVANSVETTIGTVNFGNNPNDTYVAVDLGELEGNTLAMVSFEVIVGTIPAGQSTNIVNQAQLDSTNIGFYISDDPTINITQTDPTVIEAFGPKLEDDVFKNGFE